MTAWDQPDFTALNLLHAGLGDFHVLEVIKENRMTDTVDAGTEPYDDSDQEPQGSGVAYPELPDNPNNHVYTWSPKLPDDSMLVIRSQTAQGLAEAAEALGPLARRLRAAWASVLGAPSGQEAAAPPVATGGQYGQPPQGGVNYNPQTPPANQPFPGQPAWQQAGAPQAQAAPQWGAPQAPQGQAQQRKEYPAPQGWLRMQGQKAQVDAIAAQFGVPKGNPNKGGKYNFFGLNPQGQPGKAWYCAPEAAQAFVQLNPMVG